MSSRKFKKRLPKRQRGQRARVVLLVDLQTQKAVLGVSGTFLRKLKTLKTLARSLSLDILRPFLENIPSRVASIRTLFSEYGVVQVEALAGLDESLRIELLFLGRLQKTERACARVVGSISFNSNNEEERAQDLSSLSSCFRSWRLFKGDSSHKGPFAQLLESLRFFDSRES